MEQPLLKNEWGNLNYNSFFYFKYLVSGAKKEYFQYVMNSIVINQYQITYKK